MDIKKTLAEHLADYEQTLATDMPEIAAEYQSIIDRLEIAHAGSGCPRTGDILPPFQLPDDQGRLLDMADMLAKGSLVVSMNRGHWCAFCRHELTALQAFSGKFAALDASVVAISPETQRYATRIRQRCGLEFPVLCDIDNGYALSLGLAIWAGEAIQKLFNKVDGTDLAKFQGNHGWLVPIPATFVLAPDGRIVESYVNPDFRRRLAPERIVAALKSI